MRHLLLVLATSCTSAAPAAPSAAAPSTAASTAGSTRASTTRGHATPDAAVRAYFAASDQLASKLLRSAFHPASRIQRIDDDGGLHARTQLAWWQATDAQRPCTPASERTLAVIEREGAMALVEATSRFAGHGFHDLLLAVDGPDCWILVEKVYERLAAGAAPPPWTDDAAARAIVDAKIGAARDHDPALLAATHLDARARERVDLATGRRARGWSRTRRACRSAPAAPR